MYERKGSAPLPTRRFLQRVFLHFLLSSVIILGSLCIGIAGYVYFEHMAPLDAFLNAAMLLGGMGPAAPIATPGGKLFAGLYALYSGLIFLAVSGIMLAPAVHRLLHQFHWEHSETEKG